MKHRLLCSAAGVGGPRGGPVCKGPRPGYSRPKLLQAPRAPGTNEGPISPTARGPGPKSSWWWPTALGIPTLSLSPRVPIWKMGRMDQAVPRPPAGPPCTALSCVVKGASGARAVFLNWTAGSPGTVQKPHGGTGVNSLQAAAESTASRRPQMTPWGWHRPCGCGPRLRAPRRDVPACHSTGSCGHRVLVQGREGAGANLGLRGWRLP